MKNVEDVFTAETELQAAATAFEKARLDPLNTHKNNTARRALRQAAVNYSEAVIDLESEDDK